MHHAWVVVGLFALGCGTSGEPLSGDVSINYGSSSPDLVVGTAVQATGDGEDGNMVVQLGSDDVDCDTYLDVFISFDLPEGTFVYFNVPKATGTVQNAYVSALRVDGNSSSTNTAPGMITIGAIEPRVTGSVMMTTTDDEVGTISTMGTFDVKKCF